MKRLVSWMLVVGLGLVGCTVPDLEELELERPRACNAQRTCGEGQACISGFCEAFVCDAGVPRTGYLDADGDGYGAQDAEPRSFCGGVPAGYATVKDDCDDSLASVRPGAEEACDGLDNDCQGGIDNGLPRTEFYRDGDRDGVGAGPSVQACTAPAGHVARQGDCDDANSSVSPDKTELCNNVDDNCASGADETFMTGAQALGAGCLNDTCGGVFVCDPTNETRTACNAQPPTLYYPDVDGDTQGAVGAASQKVCSGDALPGGKVANNTDCDDVDPGTRLMGAEVCDGLDNDCDNQLDEGLTCGGFFLQVFDAALGGNGHDWRTVAVDPADGYPVWIAGLAGKLIVRNAVNAPFVSHSFGDSPANTTHCGDFDWLAAWVRPSDGNVFLAGEGGRVAQHTGAACINQADAPGTDNATGIVGFESGNVTTLYIVSELGKLFTWIPGNTPVERHNNPGASSYKGIHALDPNRLLVAGRDASSNQFITSYLNGTLTADSPHTLSSTVTGYVNALWMGATNLACAVGDGGRVWRWNGATNWTLVPPPPGVTSDFSSVVMPSGTNVAYIVDRGAAGKLRRLTQYGWARAPRLLQAGSPPTPTDPDVPLYDIAMPSVGDFWMVGDGGRVYHYPQP